MRQDEIFPSSLLFIGSTTIWKSSSTIYAKLAVLLLLLSVEWVAKDGEISLSKLSISKEDITRRQLAKSRVQCEGMPPRNKSIC